jgi:hypothetical protein
MKTQFSEKGAVVRQPIYRNSMALRRAQLAKRKWLSLAMEQKMRLVCSVQLLIPAHSRAGALTV